MCVCVCVCVCVCGRNEHEVCSTLVYLHISSFRTMPVLYTNAHAHTHPQNHLRTASRGGLTVDIATFPSTQNKHFHNKSYLNVRYITIQLDRQSPSYPASWDLGPRQYLFGDKSALDSLTSQQQFTPAACRDVRCLS